MTKIGLIGFGRIGRSITRQILNKEGIEIKFIYDSNPSVENIEYLLKYDSTYGKLESNTRLAPPFLYVGNQKIRIYGVTEYEKIQFEDIDFLIDATGSNSLNKKLRNSIENYSTKLIQTNSPKCETKKVVMGVNENILSISDKFICSSICDATACSTLLASLGNYENLEYGSITTLHPWLGYQNLLDGPSNMFSLENSIYENFGLGRNSSDNLIPKLTSCISAVEDIIPSIKGKIDGMSVRVPTKIVSAASIYLKFLNKVSKNEIHQNIVKSVQYKKGFINISDEHLVSSDFVGISENAFIDKRWTYVNKTNVLRIFIWYDNEYGYSANVLRLIKYWDNMLKN